MSIYIPNPMIDEVLRLINSSIENLTRLTNYKNNTVNQAADSLIGSLHYTIGLLSTGDLRTLDEKKSNDLIYFFDEINDDIANVYETKTILNLDALNNINLKVTQKNLELQGWQVTSLTINEERAKQLIQKLESLAKEYTDKLHVLDLRSLKIKEDGEKSIENHKLESQTTLHDFKEESSNQFQILWQTLKTTCDSLVEDATKTNDSIGAILENARELQRELTGRTLSDFFDKRATKEASKAKYWTIGTWIFAGLTIALIVFSFIWQLYHGLPTKEVEINKEFYLTFIATKAILTLTLGLVAKWTSKRASRHITEEAKYHRLSINTLTLESFVSKLDEQTRNEVMKTYALKTLTEVSENNAPIDFETASGVDFIKSLLPKADK